MKRIMKAPLSSRITGFKPGDMLMFRVTGVYLANNHFNVSCFLPILLDYHCDKSFLTFVMLLSKCNVQDVLKYCWWDCLSPLGASRFSIDNKFCTDEYVDLII